MEISILKTPPFRAGTGVSKNPGALAPVKIKP